jgi:hypothetical protein
MRIKKLEELQTIEDVQNYVFWITGIKLVKTVAVIYFISEIVKGY